MARFSLLAQVKPVSLSALRNKALANLSTLDLPDNSSNIVTARNHVNPFRGSALRGAPFEVAVIKISRIDGRWILHDPAGFFLPAA